MDIIEFLETECDISIYTSGKNVAAGWIGMQCIYCDDASNHLGIRLSDLKVNCWKCGGHSIVYLIRELANVSVKEARAIAKRLGAADAPAIPKYELSDKRVGPKYILPPESTHVMPKAHRRFLFNRRFNPSLTKRRYDLRAIGNIGRYKYRIIIPITQHRNVTCFTSRAIYNTMEPKYLHADRRYTMTSVKDLVYNLDNVGMYHDAILLEGALDCWRWGMGAIASFGLYLTKQQYMAIKRMHIRNLFIMYDTDQIKGAEKKRRFGLHSDVPLKNRITYYKAVETWRVLSPLVNRCELLTNEFKKDVARLKDSQVEQIKKAIDFNKGL